MNKKNLFALQSVNNDVPVLKSDIGSSNSVWLRKLLGFVFLLLLCVNWQKASAVDIESTKDVIAQENNELKHHQKDSVLLSKLNAEQLLELKKQELENQRVEIECNSREQMPLNGVEIFLICLLPFVFVSVILVIVNKTKNRELQRKFELAMKALETGHPIPQDYFNKQGQSSPKSNLKKGVIIASIGIALLVSIFSIKNNIYPGLTAGLILSFLGGAYLFLHYFEKRKQQEIDK